MAEHKSEGGEWGPLEVIIGIIILFLILVSIFQRLFGFIDVSKPGGIFSDLKILVHNAELTLGYGKTLPSPKPLALNAPFHNAHATILFDAPGGNVLGSKGENEKGTIIGGPTQFDGNTWWKVRYADGTEGWVSGDSLVSDEGGGGSGDEIVPATGPLGTIYYTFRYVTTAVSLVLLIGILYAAFRLFQIRQAQMQDLERNGGKISPKGELAGKSNGFNKANLPGAQEIEDKKTPPGKAKWEVVERHINSESENDWRLAILEADILLDELARSRGWQGENLGERLRGIDKSDFQNLDKAWEAHKVRNTIAHEGVNFVLSSREARRVIGLYKDAFDEFNYI